MQLLELDQGPGQRLGQVLGDQSRADQETGAGPIYELLAKNAVGEILMASPAISDGLVIFRGQKNVYAIKAQ